MSFPFFIIIGLIIALFVSYFIVLSSATLYWGIQISINNNKSGVQDSITPPFSAGLSLISYISTIAFIICGYVLYGIGKGSIILIIQIISIAVFKTLIMPKKESAFFKNAIISSLIRRYANYKKANDNVRANAVLFLLDKFGVPSIEKSNKTGDTLDECYDIVAKYGEILEKTAYLAYGAPESELPYTKEEIKEAIKRILLLDAGAERAVLEHGYISLARFVSDEDAKKASEYLNAFTKIKDVLDNPDEFSKVNSIIQDVDQKRIRDMISISRKVLDEEIESLRRRYP